jgi:hypothetical protein
MILAAHRNSQFTWCLRHNLADKSRPPSRYFMAFLSGLQWILYQITRFVVIPLETPPAGIVPHIENEVRGLFVLKGGFESLNH